MKTLTKLATFVLLAAASCAAGETSLALRDLPAPVQKTIEEQTRGGRILRIAKEKKDGGTVYEVETRVQGRSRDLLIASSGAVLETEEEVAWDSLPEAVRTAVRQLAGNGKISKVEAVSRDGKKTYEAEIRKQGRREEITVTEDGRLVR